MQGAAAYELHFQMQCFCMCVCACMCSFRCVRLRVLVCARMFGLRSECACNSVCAGVYVFVYVCVSV